MKPTESIDNIIAKKLSEMTDQELLAVANMLREGLTKLKDNSADRGLFAQALEGCLIEWWVRYDAAKIAAISPGVPIREALKTARAWAELTAALFRWRAMREPILYEWTPKVSTT